MNAPKIRFVTTRRRSSSGNKANITLAAYAAVLDDGTQDGLIIATREPVRLCGGMIDGKSTMFGRKMGSWGHDRMTYHQWRAAVAATVELAELEGTLPALLHDMADYLAEQLAEQAKTEENAA